MKESDWLEAFKKAYDEYPTQDNEGYIPDRSGFKCGFQSAWKLQQQRESLESFIVKLIKESNRLNSTTTTLGWEKLNVNPEWDLKIILKKARKRGSKKEC